ncbi:5279_t:CDS:1, partial [Ambispora gerdemannii]
LLPMPQATIGMEVVVQEIGGQLRNWNVLTRQNGAITSSQGGFDFNVEGRTIRAPDIAFTPRNIYRNLTAQQLWTFQGQPFTPVFVVEVGDTTKNSDFERLNEKFKNIYFAPETSVQLGWLVDPRNQQLWSYKRTVTGVLRPYNHGWRNMDTIVNNREILPGFTLDVKSIIESISQ